MIPGVLDTIMILKQRRVRHILSKYKITLLIWVGVKYSNIRKLLLSRNLHT